MQISGRDTGKRMQASGRDTGTIITSVLEVLWTSVPHSAWPVCVMQTFWKLLQSGHCMSAKQPICFCNELIIEGLRTRVVYPTIKCGEWPEMPKKWKKNGIPPSTKVLKFPNYWIFSSSWNEFWEHFRFRGVQSGGSWVRPLCFWALQNMHDDVDTENKQTMNVYFFLAQINDG